MRLLGKNTASRLPAARVMWALSAISSRRIPFNAAELSFWWPSYWRDKQCVKSEPAAVRYELPLVDATGKQGESEA